MIPLVTLWRISPTRDILLRRAWRAALANKQLSHLRHISHTLPDLPVRAGLIPSQNMPGSVQG